MKNFLVPALLLLLISCSDEKKINTVLNESNLASTLINVKASKDTSIRLPKGGI